MPSKYSVTTIDWTVRRKEQIRVMKESGMTFVEIGQHFNVSNDQVSRVYREYRKELLDRAYEKKYG